MSLIDGRKIRDEILNTLKVKIKRAKIKPQLVIVLIGENKASAVYVHQKKIAGEKIGALVIVKHLDEGVSQKELESLVNKLNNDKKIHIASNFCF